MWLPSWCQIPDCAVGAKPGDVAVGTLPVIGDVAASPSGTCPCNGIMAATAPAVLGDDEWWR